ncbi:endonuclease domain-containing protein [Microbacterium sp. P04]|uniref:endonuclease domain-containing protein n=1 Tax=Microbacterium sp. P04 TaxID=3366947 RepID=UPI00374779B5
MANLLTWLQQRGAIAHREAALRAGFSPTALRSWVRSGEVRRIRRHWLALPSAAADLVTAAERGGRLACVSAARHRGWWLPEDLDARVHLSMPAHGRSDALADFDGVAHWSAPLAPADPHALIESVEDALAHIAECVPREAAIALWESAIRRERLDVAALRNVRWKTRAAADCAAQVSGLSDSGLESIFVFRLGPWGVPMLQQAIIAGRPVDLLIGERLVVQVDGYAFHSSSADRTRDVAHDAELRLRGYTVLRFTYAQIIHDWPAVARTLSRAIAAGAHRAA